MYRIAPRYKVMTYFQGPRLSVALDPIPVMLRDTRVNALVQLNEALMPYLCSTDTSWVEAHVRQAIREVLQRWEDAGILLGPEARGRPDTEPLFEKLPPGPVTKTEPFTDF